MVKLVHVVNSVFTSKTYFLTQEGNPSVWLVDCGDVPPIVDMLSSMGGTFIIKGVLLTHVHYDHIYGLPRLTEKFPSLRVYTNEYGKNALTDIRLNYSKYHNDPIEYESENVVTCDEGTMIELFDGVQAKVYHTPGHNPSCLTYEVGDYLFTGDAYIPGIKVVTTFKGGDKVRAAESVERILQLAEGKVVCPGHKV
ncbi:MAG: MBL fold metallo-hydrolase [Prevotella ruminicola]|uniref:MBL fold metallo-hydrolase n=1 Tax=Xylanibacter ruminicola TaxID=839 RepID=A0A9D5P7D4_XYLRU|nr:MBL fold metallo-hydrolase [Xylanibacter ruminicola]